MRRSVSIFLLLVLVFTFPAQGQDMDVYESVLEEDLKQAAVIIASFAYHTAMRDEKLPRKPLPKAPPRE